MLIYFPDFNIVRLFSHSFLVIFLLTHAKRRSANFLPKADDGDVELKHVGQLQEKQKNG